MYLVPWILFALAFIGDAALLALLLRRPKKTRKYDLTAQDLLHDLTRRGAAILKVEVIDPANLMLRSPRG